MTNSLVTRGQPRYYLHMALTDLVLAVPAALIWQYVITMESDFWKVIPSWVWPGLTGLLLVSAAFAYKRHLQRVRTGK